MPSSSESSRKSPKQCAELVPRPLRLGRDPPALAEHVAVVETEDGLRVPDIDREQHRGIETLSGLKKSSSRGVDSPMRSASASGSQRRLIAVAAQLFDRHVAGGEDLGARG